MTCRALSMISAALVILLVSAIPACAEDSPKPTGIKPPIVKFTGAKLQDGFVVASFEVTNPNEVPLPYVGYTSDSFEGGIPEGTISPIHRIEFKQDGKWNKHDVGFCGTGIGPVTLPVKKKVTFAVHLLPAGDWKAARVGLTWWDPAADETQAAVAFSGEISRQSAEAKSAAE